MRRCSKSALYGSAYLGVSPMLSSTSVSGSMTACQQHALLLPRSDNLPLVDATLPTRLGWVLHAPFDSCRASKQVLFLTLVPSPADFPTHQPNGLLLPCRA